MAGQTLYDKLWQSHLVEQRDDGSALIYIDRQLIHEVTSPQAFEGLRLSNRQPWRVDANFAVPDHNVPTEREERSGGVAGILDPVSRLQVQTLDDNCRDFDILEFQVNDVRQGIVHVVGPEQGVTLPGMTIVCGDSHTSTHGALGALAHGIGTSEVEHVLATQCLLQQKMKNMLVRVDGALQTGVTAKDVVLAIIGEIGTAGGTGYAIEFGGEVVRALSMEGRMTICNMAIEAGARAGLIAVDATTIEYVKGRPYAPRGALWEQAVAAWRELHSDADAHFDRVVELRGEDIKPQVTWGTSPEMVLPIDGVIPDPASMTSVAQPALHGPEAGHVDYRHPARHGIYRLLHQFAHRGFARRRRDRERQEGRSHGQARAGRARFRSGKATGRGGRSRQDIHRSRDGVARTGMLHVPGDELRQTGGRRALRLHLQSQF
jgi:3-isopropylmalate/(R)-2-methylmalate dehydratase large subunit